MSDHVGDGWVRQHYRVFCVTGMSNWYWLITYSWARPSALGAGRGRGVRVILLLLFLHFPSLSSSLLYLLSLFSLSLGDDTKWLTTVDVSLNPNTVNQSTDYVVLSDVSVNGRHRRLQNLFFCACLIADNISLWYLRKWDAFTPVLGLYANLQTTLSRISITRTPVARLP